MRIFRLQRVLHHFGMRSMSCLSNNQKIYSLCKCPQCGINKVFLLSCHISSSKFDAMSAIYLTAGFSVEPTLYLFSRKIINTFNEFILCTISFHTIYSVYLTSKFRKKHTSRKQQQQTTVEKWLCHSVCLPIKSCLGCGL